MRRLILQFALMLLYAVAGSAQASDCHYVYFADGKVLAYPKEYVKSIETMDGRCTITLVNDSVVGWDADEIARVSTTAPEYPQFKSFKFNDKYNEQLFDDVEASIVPDRVTAAVGAIGKWLTPSFSLDSDDGIAFVDGVEQTSKQSRLRFDGPVVYTLSYDAHQRLSMETVSGGETVVSEIPLTADMLSTNAPTSQEGEGLDMMLDGNASTFFHSTWSADKVFDVDLSKQVYIAVALPRAVSDIQFHYTGRPGTSRYNIFEWKIEASDDGNQWKEITIINESNGLPTEGNGVAYTSPTIPLGAAYSYLRFTAVRVGYKNYLCIGELKLFEVTTTSSRQAFRMVPLGREVSVDIDWLADHAAGVPRVDIDIEGGQMVSSKEYYLNANIRIQGYGVWPDFEDSVMIKGRGNTSWNEDNPYAKNPYRLKFDSSKKPFGMKKGKNWNLIAQAQRGSMMTNVMAMKAARMVGAAAANDIIPVDLYMNGDYRGSYIFTQKVGLANNSVDIDETAATLLELDRYYDETYKFKSGRYALPVNIKDPDFSDEETQITFEQVQNDFNGFEAAVYDNTNFERLVDIDMLTRFMFVNDLVLNTELGHPKSVFLYRENINHMASAYTFGPVWDFDWSFDYETNRTYCTSGATNNILSYQTSRPGCKFFTKLWNSSSWLKHEYAKLWADFTDNQLQELIDYADDYYAFANSSFKKNATKWNDGADYGNNVANMKKWLTTRANHINNSLAQYASQQAVPYTFGDVNGDGTINETDRHGVVGHILNNEQINTTQADIDANGIVSVSDVAWLGNLIKRYAENGVEQEAEIPLPKSVVMVDAITDEYASMALAAGETAGTWILTVGLNNNSPYIAFSMNINLPEGITASNATASERLMFHNLDCSEPIILAYSPDNAYISGNDGTLFSITLTANNIERGNYQISLTDIRMVDGNGREQLIAQADAMLYVSDTSISNIAVDEGTRTLYFTVDGKQLQQPRSGIVICRTLYPDGSVEVKKMIVK